MKANELISMLEMEHGNKEVRIVVPDAATIDEDGTFGINSLEEHVKGDSLILICSE